MRISKDPEVRKQEILDESIRLFLTKGYEKTSISDIAKAMGVSQGLCYRYYSSKEEIYYAALDQYADFMVHSSLSSYDLQGKSLLEQIRMMSGNISSYDHIEKEMPQMYELFHNSGNKSLHDQLFLKVAEKLVPHMIPYLEEANARGEIHIEDPEAVASFFVFGQIGILKRTDLTPEEKELRIQNTLINLLGLNDNTPE